MPNPSVGHPETSHDLEALRFFAVFQDFRDEYRVIAAFTGEGVAAAWIDAQSLRMRKRLHLEDRDGRVIENVRYRENHGGSYGHAMAILERVEQAERDRLKKQGFNFSDTGRTDG